MSQSVIAQNTLVPEDSAAQLLLVWTDTLATILNLVDDAIVSVDGEQRMVLYNKGAERIFGYRRRNSVVSPRFPRSSG